jgi:GH18 family chitinase
MNIRIKQIQLSILFILTLKFIKINGCGTPLKRICYYTSWGGVLPDPAELCTHVIYSFASIEGGVLSSVWSNPLKELRNKNKDIKLMVAVGGWG